jgi:hypothetical protein
MLAMSDSLQQVGNHTYHQPACPSCGRMLCLTRIIPRANGLPELQTYSSRLPRSSDMIASPSAHRLGFAQEAVLQPGASLSEQLRSDSAGGPQP